MANRGKMDNQDNKALQGKLVSKDLQATKDPQATKEHQDNKAHLDPKDLLDK
jgi:hypothetical protein